MDVVLPDQAHNVMFTIDEVKGCALVVIGVVKPGLGNYYDLNLAEEYVWTNLAPNVRN
jgi:hypothetical protein